MLEYIAITACKAYPFSLYLQLGNGVMLCKGCIFSLLLFCLAGCTAPVEETKSFASAVTTVKGAGDVLWDDMDVAERQRHLSLYPPSRSTFNLNDAYYYSSIGEPPYTAEFRRSLKVVNDYAQLLLVLVQGNNLSTTQAEIRSFATTISQVAGVPGLSLAIGQLQPVLDQALKAASVEEARQIVLSGSPVVFDIIEMLRNDAPIIFKTLTWNLASVDPHSPSAAKVAGYRKTVANFVVLLDRLADSLQRMVIAYQKPSNSVSLASVAKAAADLESDATAFRRAYASLRSK